MSSAVIAARLDDALGLLDRGDASDAYETIYDLRADLAPAPTAPAKGPLMRRALPLVLGTLALLSFAALCPAQAPAPAASGADLLSAVTAGQANVAADQAKLAADQAKLATDIPAFVGYLTANGPSFALNADGSISLYKPDATQPTGYSVETAKPLGGPAAVTPAPVTPTPAPAPAPVPAQPPLAPPGPLQSPRRVVPAPGKASVVPAPPTYTVEVEVR